MRFFQPIIKGITSPQYARQLKTRIPPLPEIVIGNNAAIFAMYEKFERGGRPLHPDVRLICPEYWLDGVHPSYLVQPWGQNKHSLPKVARDLFTKLYPEYAGDKFIQWGHMQELRKAALHSLEKHYNVPIYYGDPSIKIVPDNSYEITVKYRDKNGAWTTYPTIYATADTHFYNWHSRAKKHILGGVEQLSSHELYRMASEELPNSTDYPDIIVFGGGLSSQWLAKLFATPSTTRNIICIVHNADQVRAILPSNAAIDLNRIVILNLNETTIHFDKDDIHLMIVESLKYNKTFQGIACSAIGMETPEDIVKDIPREQLIMPSQWTSNSWFAPKNIPRGSLNHSKHKWDVLTENLTGIELYFDADHHPAHRIRKNCLPELLLDLRFDRALEQAVSMLDNSIPEIHIHDFLVATYKESCNPSAADIKKFETGLFRTLSSNITHLDSKENEEQKEKQHPEFTH